MKVKIYLHCYIESPILYSDPLFLLKSNIISEAQLRSVISIGWVECGRMRIRLNRLKCSFGQLCTKVQMRNDEINRRPKTYNIKIEIKLQIWKPKPNQRLAIKVRSSQRKISKRKQNKNKTHMPVEFCYYNITTC